MSAFAASALAQPANDSCAAPTVVELGVTPFNSLGATTDGPAASCGFNGDPGTNDVWFSFTPAIDGVYSISTCGSLGLDSLLTVLESCAGPELACNEDSNECELFSVQSLVQVALTADVRVLIRVAGFNGDTGPGMLTVEFLAAAVSNDNCAEAIEVELGDTPFSSAGSTTDGPDASCGFLGVGGSNDVWFKFTPDISGVYTISTCNSPGFDSIVTVLTSCGGSELACNDDGDSCPATQSQLQVSLTGGVEVLIRVAGFLGDTTATGSLFLAFDGDALPNDNCSEPMVVGEGSTFFSSAGATSDGAATSCGFFGDPGSADVWFTFTPGASGGYEISTCGSTFDTQITIHSACGGAELACSEDSDACGGGGLQSLVRVSIQAGQPVLIRVAGFNGQSGDGVLNVNLAGDVPSNDHCDGATIAIEGANPFDSSFADTDGSASCGFDGATGTHDVYFSFTAPRDGLLTATTCPSDNDTLVSILDSCGGLELACSEDSAGDALCSNARLAATQNTTYIIRVASFADEGLVGNLFLSVTDFPAGCVPQPSGSVLEGETCGAGFNDGCINESFAEEIPSNAQIYGTIFADNGLRDTDWFSFTVTETSDVTLTVDAEFAGNIFLLSVDGDCNIVELGAGTVGACTGPATINARVAAGSYQAFVGHDDFEDNQCFIAGLTHYALTLTSAPVGACCNGDGCTLQTEAACAAAGGTFQGDGTNCGGYSLQAGSEAFIDISGVGSEVFFDFEDDGGATVALPFPFNFYGDIFNDVWVGTNGFAQFPGIDGSASRFNVPLPDAAEPGNFMAVLWDDFDLRAQAGNGAVFTLTDGEPGSRRFIISWEDVPQWNGGGLGVDSNNFQIILYEAGGFEYRYGSITNDFSINGDAGAFAGATVGVEDRLATGLSIHHATGSSPVSSGTSLSFQVAAGACDSADPCDAADFNNDDFINPDDLADFITCFFLDVQFPGFCPAADFNGDTSRDPDDLADFITRFFLCR